MESSVQSQGPVFYRTQWASHDSLCLSTWLGHGVQIFDKNYSDVSLMVFLDEINT